MSRPNPKPAYAVLKRAILLCHQLGEIHTGGIAPLNGAAYHYSCPSNQVGGRVLRNIAPACRSGEFLGPDDSVGTSHH